MRSRTDSYVSTGPKQRPTRDSARTGKGTGACQQPAVWSLESEISICRKVSHNLRRTQVLLGPWVKYYRVRGTDTIALSRTESKISMKKHTGSCVPPEILLLSFCCLSELLNLGKPTSFSPSIIPCNLAPAMLALRKLLFQRSPMKFLLLNPASFLLRSH